MVPRILHVTPEMAPLIKRGGLGDVAGSLPHALAEEGLDARVVLPAYPGVLEQARRQGRFCHRLQGKLSVALNWRVYHAAVFHTRIGRTSVYLLEQPELFNSETIYPTETTPETTLPFAFLSLAALELPGVTEWRPHIFHVHDWPGALLPTALRWHRHYRHLREEYDTVLTIHNLAHQWITTPDALPVWGIGKESFTLDGLEFFGTVNVLKGGIVTADAISTVSPRYSWEIQGPQGGMGLEGVLTAQRHKLQGILNGLDDTAWDPGADPLLPAHYSSTELKGKGRCREALLRRCGLADDGRPLAVFVGRLFDQKGVDLLLGSAEELAGLGLRLLVLGSGHPAYERAVTELADRYPGDIFARTSFDEELAHLLYAGGDILLMPSLFEPCGLSQMIALRYGTIPVVRAVGGLADTVFDADGMPDGNGFVFTDHTPEELYHAVERALEHWRREDDWKKLITRGMNGDYSWRSSAAAYRRLYEGMMGFGSEPGA
ncbi:MAG: glycogen synthase [Synergistales bacterium]|nr:glycogen synthase [Synergistales bacterium]